MILGTTYSHREIAYLKLDNEHAFQELLNLNFDVIRLGIYWNESHPQKNLYDLSTIKMHLKKCEAAKQKVVLTVGMKTPRWPEFYVPSWRVNCSIPSHFSDLAIFLAHVVRELQMYECVDYWQVENEPLDPSGPDGHVIPEEFLKKEIEIVKSIDKKRKVIITVWGNHMKKRNTFAIAAKFADVVGIDLYYKVPTILNLYQGPRSPLAYYKHRIATSTKPVWITELQAEPWENSEKAKRMKDPPSMNPLLLRENYEKAKSLDPEAILFWGFEYWYKRKMLGDDRYFKYIEDLLRSERPR